MSTYNPSDPLDKLRAYLTTMLRGAEGALASNLRGALELIPPPVPTPEEPIALPVIDVQERYVQRRADLIAEAMERLLYNHGLRACSELVTLHRLHDSLRGVHGWNADLLTLLRREATARLVSLPALPDPQDDGRTDGAAVSRVVLVSLLAVVQRVAEQDEVGAVRVLAYLDGFNPHQWLQNHGLQVPVGAEV